jgi:serine/threonine protein kinase
LATPQEPGPPPTGTPPTRAERPRRATGPRNAEVADLLAGTMLGKYRIGRRLGSGGMGVVYQATHMEIGRAVALKVLNADLAEGTRARLRFLREAAAASKIDHPNVVKVTDYGAEGAVPYLVMELLRGEDLSTLLRRHRRGLPVTEAANILLAVCAAVFTAHQARVIHRDLKPRNIFLARTKLFEMGPKILDFGISKLEDDDGAPLSSLTDPGYLLGTPHYLSPEQVAGGPADARSDQFALGVVLYECLTGQRPHHGHETAQVLARIRQGAVSPPRRLRPDLPESLEAAVLRAMALKPEARFPTVHALGAALLPFASPKQQVAWSDYYLSDQPAAPALADAPTPEHPPLAATQYLPETADPIDAPGPIEEPAATATLTLRRNEPIALESAIDLPRPDRAPLRILLLLAVGSATFAGASYLMQHWPPETPRERLPPAIAPARVERPAAIEPPPVPPPAAPTQPASTAAPTTSAPAKVEPPPSARRPAQRPQVARRIDRRATALPPPALRRNPVHVPVPTPLRVPPRPPDPAPARSDEDSPSPAPILH